MLELQTSLHVGMPFHVYGLSDVPTQRLESPRSGDWFKSGVGLSAAVLSTSRWVWELQAVPSGKPDQAELLRLPCVRAGAGRKVLTRLSQARLLGPGAGERARRRVLGQQEKGIE